ncbi:MAG TPA: hypothetical protein VGP43_07250 [Chitinophagaceae bacterium]|nr:hypothetical protein [Chitinophagaceae bacterium]
MKQNLKEANYQYEKYLGNRNHLLKNLETGTSEIFFAKKNHASWGIIWKNTHLEFARYTR